MDTEAMVAAEDRARYLDRVMTARFIRSILALRSDFADS